MADALIRLFNSDESSFTSNGLGSLIEAISCKVSEERNGLFELEMEYPISGKHYNDILLRNIIVARPNPYDDPQAFRIYSISKPISGRVTINAEHISYDLAGIPCEIFTAISAGAAMSGLLSHAVITCPFNFYTNIPSQQSFALEAPSSIRSVLGGEENSILSVYGGEYKFDNRTVYLYSSRGSNNGVTIRYGKNLTDLKQDESSEEMYTGIYPYWSNSEFGLVTLPEKVVYIDGPRPFTKAMPVDFSDHSFYEGSPPPEGEPDTRPQRSITVNELRDLATAYISEHNIAQPKVSLEVSFEQLHLSSEYSQYAILETVKLCDTVTVQYPKLGVSSTLKCIKTEYDVLTNKYTKLELGEAKNDLSRTIAAQDKNISTITERSDFAQRMNEIATQIGLKITGGLGGYVMLHDADNDGKPDEILILQDGTTLATVRKIWRWNLAGLGYSDRGYASEYFSTAITSDGEIVGSFIMANTIDGDQIKANAITANHIQAGTITAEKLDISVEEMIDAKDNAIAGTIRTEFRAADGVISAMVSELSDNTTHRFAEVDVTVDAIQQSVSDKFTAVTDDMILMHSDITSIESTAKSNSTNIASIDEAITGEIAERKTQYTNLSQKMDSISMQFASLYSGGANVIANSSGLNGLNEWTYYSGVSSLPKAEASIETISGSLFRIPAGQKIEQRIRLVAETTYTLSMRIKSSKPGSGAAYIVNGDTSVPIDGSITDQWQTLSCTFVATGSYDSFIRVTCATGEIYAADIMLVEGETPSYWTSRNDEVYATNIKFDKKGIHVANTESTTETLIDERQFAIMNNGETVMTVNMDTTKLKKTEIDESVKIGDFGEFVVMPDGASTKVMHLVIYE